MNLSSNAPITTTTAAAFLRVGGIATAAAQQQVAGGEGLVVVLQERNDDTPSFPDNWNDLLKLEEPLDWEAFKNSKLLETMRSNFVTISILLRASASISIIASALLIVHVLRSHQGLSTTYHRLMCGLSIADIISSSAFAVGSLMAPKEMSYMIPGARGNGGTCTTQGFFVVVGTLMSVYYNCSICFYYLAIIKYNRSDAYIAKKLERWLHVIPITVALMNGFMFVAVKGYNKWSNICFKVPYDPPHCIGYKDGEKVDGFDIPCGRGSAFYDSIFIALLINIAATSPPPIIIITTMFMMYLAVLKIERNVARYGVSTLRLHVQQEREHLFSANDDTRNEDTAPNIIWKILQDCTISCCFHSLRHLLTCRNNSNNNNGSQAADANVKRCCMRMTTMSLMRRSITSTRVSRKKAVLQMASGYIVAWALFWVPALLHHFLGTFETRIISNALNPLQGLFNFIVFMSPKVRTARKMKCRRGQQTTTSNLSWCKVAFDVYMSRGERRRA